MEPLRHVTLPALLRLAQRQRRALLPASTVMEAEQQLARWLTGAALVAGPRHSASGILGSWSVTLGLRSGADVTAAREPDGTPTAKLFTVLSYVPAHSHAYRADQVFSVHAFSALYAWLHGVYGCFRPSEGGLQAPVPATQPQPRARQRREQPVGVQLRPAAATPAALEGSAGHASDSSTAGGGDSDDGSSDGGGGSACVSGEEAFAVMSAEAAAAAALRAGAGAAGGGEVAAEAEEEEECALPTSPSAELVAVAVEYCLRLLVQVRACPWWPLAQPQR